MAYSAYAVANAFIDRAQQGWMHDLTPMKLQKMLYFAHAWHLKVMGAPLLDDHFARWQYGPVIPALYHEFKAYGSMPIRQPATTLALTGQGYSGHVPIIPRDDQITWGLIDSIIRNYGGLSGQQLSMITHQQGTAWSNGGGPTGTVITQAEILADTTIGVR